MSSRLSGIKKTFTNKGLKHEINLLCQSAPKAKSQTSILL